MLILNKQQILKLVDYAELSEAITQSLHDLETGKIIMPPRMHAQFNSNTLLLMPCYDGKYFATKQVSVFPENSQKNLPVIYGSAVLNDGKTGKPLAMMEGSTLTGLRTGAVGGIGIRNTTPTKASTLGLVGTGVQGYYQLLFACAERKIKRAYIYNPNLEVCENFKQKVKRVLPELEIIFAESTSDLVKHSEIIITATNSSTPVLPNDTALYQGKHLIAVGSYTPQMQEIPEAVFKNARQIIVDTEHAIHESGDVINPIKGGFITKENIVPISKIITAKAELSKQDCTIFKSVGMALFDLAAAKYFYEKALKKNMGTLVDFL